MPEFCLQFYYYFHTRSPKAEFEIKREEIPSSLSNDHVFRVGKGPQGYSWNLATYTLMNYGRPFKIGFTVQVEIEDRETVVAIVSDDRSLSSLQR